MAVRLQWILLARAVSPHHIFFIRWEGGGRAPKTYRQEFYLKLHFTRAVHVFIDLNFDAQFHDSTEAKCERQPPAASFIYILFQVL